MTDDRASPLRLRSGAVIPRDRLRMTAVTSSGPGGQHVNRSNTAVELRIDVADLPLDEDERELVRRRLAGRITAGGELRVSASQDRSQLRNRRAAEERLVDLVDDALDVDAQRVPTRPSRASLERRRLAREREQRRRTERRWSPGDE